jgi:filamentous hemagglutinin
MYANKIKLVGTEKGLGVNYAGALNVKDDFIIKYNGDVTFSGKAALHSLDLSGQSASNVPTFFIKGSGHIQVSDKANLTAYQLFTEKGSKLIAKQLDVVNDGPYTIDHAGQIQSHLLNIQTDTFRQQDSGKVETNALQAETKHFNIAGQTQINQEGKIKADLLITDTTGNIKSEEKIDFTVTQKFEHHGLIVAPDLAITSTELRNRGKLQSNTMQMQTGEWHSGGKVIADQLIVKTKQLYNSGKIFAKQMDIHADGIYNSGDILVEQLDIDASEIKIYQGAIETDQLKIKTNTLNTGPTNNIQGKEKIDFIATQKFEHHGLVSVPNLSIISSDLRNSGQFQSKIIKMQIDELHNDSKGKIEAEQLEITSKQLHNAGELYSKEQMHIHADKVQIYAGKVEANELKIEAKHLTNNGQIYSGQQADINTQHLQMIGKLQGAETVNLNVRLGGFTNQGTITANTLSLDIAPHLFNEGYIQAQQKLNVRTNYFRNAADKKVISQGDIYFAVNEFHNLHNAMVWAKNDIILEGQQPGKRASLIFNDKGLIQANRDLTLRANRFQNYGFIVHDTDILEDYAHDHSGNGLFSPCNEHYDPFHCQRIKIRQPADDIVNAELKRNGGGIKAFFARAARNYIERHHRRVLEARQQAAIWYYNPALDRYEPTGQENYYPHEEYFYFTRWVGPRSLAYPKHFHEFVQRHPALNNMVRVRNRLIQPGMGWRDLYKHDSSSHEAEEGGARFTADIYTQRLAPHIKLHSAKTMAGQHMTIDAEITENRYGNIAAGGNLFIQGSNLINEGRSLQKRIGYTLHSWKDGNEAPMHHEHRENIFHIPSIIAVGGIIHGNLAGHIQNGKAHLAELANAHSIQPALVGMIQSRFGQALPIANPNQPLVEQNSQGQVAAAQSDFLSTLGFMTVETGPDGLVFTHPTLSDQPVAHADFPFASLIVGKGVALEGAQTLDNHGTIAGQQGVYLQAQAINQVNGHLLSAESIVAQAERDIHVLGGEIKAKNIYLASGNNLHIATAKTLYRYPEGSQEFAHQTTALTADVDMATASQHNTHVTGAQLHAGNTLSMQAGNDIVIDSLTLKLHLEKLTDIVSITGTRWWAHDSNQEQQSSVQGEGGLGLHAKQDVLTEGAALLSDKQIDIRAGRDIWLGTKTEASYTEFAENTEKKSLFGKKREHKEGYEDNHLATGTRVEAETVTLSAGRNLIGAGLTVLANGDIKLTAGQDITLTSAALTHADESHQTSQGRGQTGHGWGKFKTTSDSSANQVTQQPSVVGSYEGNIEAIAKGHMLLAGTDLIAGQHIVLSGSTISLLPVQETQHSEYLYTDKKAGLMFGMSGIMVDAARALESAAKASREGDKEKAGLYALKAAAIASNALYSGKNPQAEQVKTETNQPASADNGAGGLESVQHGNGGDHLVKGTLSIGSQNSRSAYEGDTLQNRVSTVTALGDVTLTATGEAGSNPANTREGNIDLHGAQIIARRAILKAAQDIVLHSAIDTTAGHSQNKQAGGSVGIGLGYGGQQNGFTLELAAYLGKGHEDQESRTHRNAKVEGKEVYLEAGGDTSLKGAQIRGEKVVIHTMNLYIESQQDMEKFDAKQRQTGGTASICVYPYCYGTSSGGAAYHRGFIDSHYESVKEQSGVQAGEGGYDVKVKGHTELVGGAMNSTAIPELNAFETGTLHTSDLDNTAHYHAGQHGASLSFSGSTDQQGNTAFNPGKDMANSGKNTAVSNMLPEQTGESHSTTKSVIAPGTVKINDEKGQLEKTGKTVEETLAELNRDTSEAHKPLDKIFDPKEVKRQQEINQIISDIAQQVAPIIYDQIGEALKDQNAATKAAVHGAIGGALSAALGGNAAAGAVGGAVTSLTVDTLGKKLDELDLEPDTRDAILKVVSGLIGKASGELIGGGNAGNVAAFTAMEATEYNYLEHKQIKDKYDELAKAKTEEERREIEKFYAHMSRAQRKEIVGNLMNDEQGIEISQAKELRQELTNFLTDPACQSKECQFDVKSSIEEMNVHIEHATNYWRWEKEEQPRLDRWELILGGVNLLQGAVKQGVKWLGNKVINAFGKSGPTKVGQIVAKGEAGMPKEIGQKPLSDPGANNVLPKDYTATATTQLSGGAARAQKYSDNWVEASLNKAIEKFAGKEPVITTTKTGKRVYTNPQTGIQVVEDLKGSYFRIYDPKIPSKRSYLGLDGKVPNNKVLENGKQLGRTQSEYNEITHFKKLKE